MTVISGVERRRRWSPSEREEIVMASFAPGAVVARVARQFDVSTSLIYKWRRQALQSEAMFVPAVMTDGDGSMVPAVPEVGRGGGRGDSRRDDPGEGRADSPVIRVDVAGGAVVSIAATAPARLVLAVLRALR